MTEEIKKPMIPINAATYWHALRTRALLNSLMDMDRYLKIIKIIDKLKVFLKSYKANTFKRKDLS